MILIHNAAVYIGRRFHAGAVLFSEQKIERLFFPVIPEEALSRLPRDTRIIDAAGMFLIPGLVDVHTHGANGADCSDGGEKTMQTLSRYYAKEGVTSFLATAMSMKEDRLKKVCISASTALCDGAKCLGVHLEGPFLNPAMRGAQAEEALIPPDYALFERLQACSDSAIKLITVAPELDGALEFIKRASKSCAVSIGHTAADYDTAVKAFKAGATRVTHLFNAMPPFLHRAPGPIGAAIDCGAAAELICDGIHLHPCTVRAAFKLFQKKLVFISDSMRAAGLADGEYELGGQKVCVGEGRATLKENGKLAGSTIHLMDAVRRAVQFGVSLEDAVYAATAAPCDSISRPDLGRIELGKAADLVLLRGDLTVSSVFIGGRLFQEKTV